MRSLCLFTNDMRNYSHKSILSVLIQSVKETQHVLCCGCVCVNVCIYVHAHTLVPLVHLSRGHQMHPTSCYVGHTVLQSRNALSLTKNIYCLLLSWLTREIIGDSKHLIHFTAPSFCFWIQCNKMCNRQG